MIKDVPESIVEWRHFKVKERKFLKLKRQHFANQIGEVWANERGEIWQLNVQNYYNLIELSTDRSLGGARIAPQLCLFKAQIHRKESVCYDFDL